MRMHVRVHVMLTRRRTGGPGGSEVAVVQTWRMVFVAAAMSVDARSITGRSALTGPMMFIRMDIAECR